MRIQGREKGNERPFVAIGPKAPVKLEYKCQHPLSQRHGQW